MPARRYYIAILPVSHINGKMAPVSVKCPDTDDPAAVDNAGFWYGYRLSKKPNVNYYGIRTKSRNLQNKPYTANELESRTLFTTALIAVREHFGVSPDWELMLEDFNKQSEYITPRGYAVSKCRANNGEWLEKWKG